MQLALDQPSEPRKKRSIGLLSAAAVTPPLAHASASTARRVELLERSSCTTHGALSVLSALNGPQLRPSRHAASAPRAALWADMGGEAKA